MQQVRISSEVEPYRTLAGEPGGGPGGPGGKPGAGGSAEGPYLIRRIKNPSEVVKLLKDETEIIVRIDDLH